MISYLNKNINIYNVQKYKINNYKIFIQVVTFVIFFVSTGHWLGISNMLQHNIKNGILLCICRINNNKNAVYNNTEMLKIGRL